MAEHPSLEEMIAEVKRELALRKNVYAKFTGKKRTEAHEYYRRMERVLYVLEWMHGNEIAERGLPRPADMIAALVHIERMLQSAAPGTLAESLRKVCTDTLTGLPGRDSKQQDALREIQKLFLSSVDHESFRMQAKKIADGALS